VPSVDLGLSSPSPGYEHVFVVHLKKIKILFPKLHYFYTIASLKQTLLSSCYKGLEWMNRMMYYPDLAGFLYTLTFQGIQGILSLNLP
jgi:hypothetical protein